MNQASSIEVKANLSDPLWRCQNLYVIRDKKRQRRKLRFNTCQQRIIDAVGDRFRKRLPIRHYDLKYRQGGVSTLWELLYLDDTIFRPNTISGIVAQKQDTNNHLWDVVRFAHASMPSVLRPPLLKDSAKTLAFPNGSKMFVSLKVQSTTLHNLHVSEYPLCDPDEIEQTIAAVPPDANITLEGVAEGMNHAYDKWRSVADGWTRCFHPWFIQKEYRDAEPIPEPQWTEAEWKLTALALKEYGVKLDGRQVSFRRRMHRELKRLALQEFAEDPITCFLGSGYPYFDRLKVQDIQSRARKPIKAEDPFHDRDGRECWETEVWEEPTPGHMYGAGADVAEGSLNEKGDPDYSVLSVVCVDCKRVAMRYRARVGVDTFYRVCDKHGRSYNNALLAVERNNHGHAVLLGLRETSKYPRLYYEDPVEKAVSVGKPIKVDLRFGWETTPVTKPLVLDQLKQLIEGNFEDDVDHYRPELSLDDGELLHELFSFRGDKGKLQAGPGKHDDVVMATAIAVQMYLKIRRTSSVLDQGAIHVGNPSESKRLFGQ